MWIISLYNAISSNVLTTEIMLHNSLTGTLCLPTLVYFLVQTDLAQPFWVFFYIKFNALKSTTVVMMEYIQYKQVFIINTEGISTRIKHLLKINEGIKEVNASHGATPAIH